MAAVPFALSVHNFISSVGADAGFASVIGLAILTLLYFSYARDISRLREEAADLAARLQEAEARLADARAQAVVAEAMPSSAPQVTAAAAGPGRLQLAPGAPAGMGAPALAAATRFIPVTARPAPARPLTPPVTAPAPAVATAAGPAPLSAPLLVPTAAATVEASAQASAPAQAPAPAPASAPTPAPASAPVPARPPAPARAMPADAPEDSRPAPATVAGGANGSSSPVRAAASAAAPQLASPPPRVMAPPRSPLVPAPSAPRGPSAGARRFIVLLGILVLIGAAAAVVIITSGTGSSNPAPQVPASNAPGPTQPLFIPGHVTVAVLNGTAINQLAHHVADRLAKIGYQRGVIATASNQTVNSTVVAFLPGSPNKSDAMHVATALHLPRTAVQPINQAAQSVACPPPNTCTANVVVTVGSDLSGV